MADIFVCYRREDAQWSAGRINDSLVHAFGHGRVFFDTVTIQPGEDFVEVLGAKVGGCRVLLAVIGPNWLDILDRRRGDDNDFVRVEIAEALRRNVRIVPVLIDGARPPPAERLPVEFKPLSRRHAVPVRADTFHADVNGLIKFLREFLNAASGLNPEDARAAIDAADRRRLGRSGGTSRVGTPQSRKPDPTPDRRRTKRRHPLARTVQGRPERPGDGRGAGRLIPDGLA